MKIKKEKMLKVNICFVLSFQQKQVVPFWKGEKLPIFCCKYFLFRVSEIPKGLTQSFLERTS